MLVVPPQLHDTVYVKVEEGYRFILLNSYSDRFNVVWTNKPKKQVLLLGPGEAGKSTVLKQLKCIYKGGIPLAEQRVRERSNKQESWSTSAVCTFRCVLPNLRTHLLLLLLLQLNALGLPVATAVLACA